MAEGNGGGEAAKQKDGGGGGSEEREYTILGAVGDKEADPTELSWRVLDVVKATTQAKAKEALLTANPQFPELSDKRSGGPADTGNGASQPTDLQSLVRGERLWLHAESGWSPKPVVVNQPPPKFEGL